MSRNLVLCFDGTDNKYGANNTNVVRLYSMIDRSRPNQTAYYQPGIGTMTPIGMYARVKRKIARVVDLAMANLLDDHVEGGYRFLMRNYQPGDRIFLFGFSRGAYTARVLAGMIHKVGLLSQGNEELIPFAWNLYAKGPTDQISAGFSATFSSKAPIYFLGLWDTVSSVSWAWHPRVYAYTHDNPSVQFVRHAISLDERRQRFAQNTWTDKRHSGQDVKEVWFAGVHSDIGGGYPSAESGLAKITLQWMVEQLRPTGLQLDEDHVNRLLPTKTIDEEVAPDPLAPAHESLRGLWWIVEFIPLPRRDPTRNFETRWEMHFGRPRRIYGKPTLHRSVLTRKASHPGYQPKNFPGDYDVDGL